MASKILIVEDDADTREGLALLLQLLNFTVITAEDGQAGLNRAKTEYPDLILTDIMMPNLDGIEMTALIRARSDLSKIPVIVISAYEEQAAEAIKAGANRFMHKPVETRELISEIKSFLR